MPTEKSIITFRNFQDRPEILWPNQKEYLLILAQFFDSPGSSIRLTRKEFLIFRSHFFTPSGLTFSTNPRVKLPFSMS